MATPRFARVTEQVIMDERLTHRDLRVLLAILIHCDSSGKCWPKRESISRVARLPLTRISEVTSRLERFGYLSKSRRGPGRGTVYTVFDTAVDKPPEVTETVTSTPLEVTETVTLEVTETVTPPIPSSEQTIEQKKEQKKRKPPTPFASERAAKGLPHADLFDRAWELAREVNRAAAGRCCRKTSVARWTAKCQGLDAARLCLECWELEVGSRRAGSGLQFQRGFQVYLNAEPWTDPHALDDLRAAIEITKDGGNGNGRTSNGNGTRRKTEAERYHENMAEARRRRGDPDPDSYRIEGLDDDYEEFYRREEFKGRTFDG